MGSLRRMFQTSYNILCKPAFFMLFKFLPTTTFKCHSIVVENSILPHCTTRGKAIVMRAPVRFFPKKKKKSYYLSTVFLRIRVNILNRCCTQMLVCSIRKVYNMMYPILNCPRTVRYSIA